MEEWRCIDQFPFYEVSNKGKVRIKNGKMLPGSLNRDGYLRVCMKDNGKEYTRFIHTVVAKTFLPNPDNLPIPDHIDRDKLNNAVENLRWVGYSTNGHNRNKIQNASTKYYGVIYYPQFKREKKYKAQIMKDGTSYYLGYFSTGEEAARAYDAKARELYGEHARTNF